MKKSLFIAFCLIHLASVQAFSFTGFISSVYQSFTQLSSAQKITGAALLGATCYLAYQKIKPVIAEYRKTTLNAKIESAKKHNAELMNNEAVRLVFTDPNINSEIFKHLNFPYLESDEELLTDVEQDVDNKVINKLIFFPLTTQQGKYELRIRKNNCYDLIFQNKFAQENPSLVVSCVSANMTKFALLEQKYENGKLTGYLSIFEISKKQKIVASSAYVVNGKVDQFNGQGDTLLGITNTHYKELYSNLHQFNTDSKQVPNYTLGNIVRHIAISNDGKLAALATKNQLYTWVLDAELVPKKVVLSDVDKITSMRFNQQTTKFVVEYHDYRNEPKIEFINTGRQEPARTLANYLHFKGVWNRPLTFLPKEIG